MVSAQYCVKADLLLPSEALDELQDSDITSAIVAASSEADSYLSTALDLPLVVPADPDTNLPIYPPALVNAVAQMATYRAMLKRGYAPMAGQNDTIKGGYNDAIRFLKDVAKGDAVLQVKDSNSDAQDQDGTGPSSSSYLKTPRSPQAQVFNEREEFFHDCGSVVGGAGAFRGSRDRGY